jgi:hypothetical protein
MLYASVSLEVQHFSLEEEYVFRIWTSLPSDTVLRTRTLQSERALTTGDGWVKTFDSNAE